MTDPDRNREASPTLRDEELLDAHFHAGRTATEAPSAALLERIAVDAAAVLAERRVQSVPAARPVRGGRRTGWRARLDDLRVQLGGGLAMGGLALATAVGVWIGAQPPEVLLDVESRLFGAVIVIELAEDFWGLEDI